MHTHLFPSSLLFSVIITFVLIPTSSCADERYANCSATFECANIPSIAYPFWGGNRPEYCGHPRFELACDGDLPEIKIATQYYRVLNIDNTTHTLTVARSDYWNNYCPASLANTSLDFAIVNYAPYNQNLTLYYGCNSALPSEVSVFSNASTQFSCAINNRNLTGYLQLFDPGATTSSILKYLSDCDYSVLVPVLQSAAEKLETSLTPLTSLVSALRGGFGVQWDANNRGCDECEASGGACGYDSGDFACYCRNGTFPTTCGDAGHRRKNFIGQGGYGGVYKGKLFDGRAVAVKLLIRKSTRNGEDFINEVASISRTSHVNIVTLLGFCYEGSRRALLYEFMPNGSLDKFIYDHKSPSNCHNLTWETLLQIAVGIARGLEYLHRGCTTRILHFDIKPHNILLDEYFCPKISDFGLSKLCHGKESIVSMMDTRGTYGYIAPEVYCRNFGGVSYKSDVYSYGMLVLEMVGGRRNIDVERSHTSEIYFLNWIYKHLDLEEDLRLLEVVTAEEEEMARKMILVSLWCIQTIPSDRPSMTKVVEMLEGSLQSLSIPPKPTLSSA
ncbi:LEAF RUST 10 DISEASE-RESISTANCE LOCUS RECEPTOR-LIKE PROTEIN KINASE-like 2.1 [Malania oleifera]|uniref:LEAF RUST 10 DISEASE-RESISTANCE LOCUS RECEPTOR-LIKE PROTEIN KINASE-like 2.1 n=1 Tax=Malania oleifera TaxID=397392 RepID=UPI0025AE0208|nr:LEAF RUST 10 DISEASE-RESISTANCE LOCUS RECEPTOR-LIKE PROTEIN KINASE-like 2.1 [Malania oleifera]